MAAQAGLCLAWSETPEDTFCRVVAQLLLLQVIYFNDFYYFISEKHLVRCERYDNSDETQWWLFFFGNFNLMTNERTCKARIPLVWNQFKQYNRKRIPWYLSGKNISKNVTLHISNYTSLS